MNAEAQPTIASTTTKMFNIFFATAANANRGEK